MEIRKIARDVVSLYYGKENLDMDKVMLLDHIPKESDSIPKLSERISTLILQAVRMSGLEPDANMSFIGEELTNEEYDNVKAFLNWLNDNDKMFGKSNIKELWKEFHSK